MFATAKLNTHDFYRQTVGMSRIYGFPKGRKMILGRPPSELFSALHLLADQKVERGLIISGGSSGDLISQGSEIFAGRIGCIELAGFSLSGKPEIGVWRP